MDAQLQDWAQDRVSSEVHPPDAAQLRRLVEARMQERRRARLRQSVLLAAAVVLAVFAWSRGGEDSTAVVATELAPATAPAQTLAVQELPKQTSPSPEPPVGFDVLLAEGTTTGDIDRAQVGAEGRIVLALGEDRLGLDAQTELHLLSAEPTDTRIRLERGVVAAEVDSRETEGFFRILAGEAEIRVIGTRFGVEHGSETHPLRVWVDEGIVQVNLGQTSWELKAGQLLELNALGQGGLVHRPEAGARLRSLLAVTSKVRDQSERVSSIPEPLPTEPPSIDELKLQLVAPSANLDAIRSHIEDRLQRNPTDVPAWELLGSVESRAGLPDAQLVALRQVIAHGEDRAVQRARFDAAELLSTQQSGRTEARLLLQAYLAQADAPGQGQQLPAAMLALAKLERDTGATAAARVHLEQLISRFPGEVQASEARAILATLPADVP